MKYLYIIIYTVLIYICFINISLATAATEENINIIWPTSEKGIITSPFGERGDYGSGSFHYGVDVGYDEGIPVIAVADGIIDYYGEADGFVYAAVIYHPKLNISSLYGDIDIINGLHSGQEVKQGDVIGIIAPTRGTSTGPHLHFELHAKRYPFFGGSQNGAFDPLPYLNGAEVSPGGAFDNYENDTNIDYSVIADIAKPIKNIIDTIITTCVKAVNTIVPYVLYLFITLSTIGLVLSGLQIISSNEYSLNAIIKSLVSKSLIYCFFIFLITNWSNVLNLIKNYFSEMGAIATSQTVEQVGQLVSDPTAIIQKGAQLTVPFFNYLGSFNSSIAITLSLPAILLVGILGFIILGMFLLIGIQILLAYIEFYIICVFSIFDLSFAGLKETRHLRFVGNGINAIFASSMKLLWYIFFSAILSLQLTSMNFSDMTTMGNRGAINLEQAGPEAITVFMSAIKMQESTNNYYVYSYDGYGYGAYQISFTNWNAWVEEAGLQSDYDWSPHENMQPAWSPERQDAVARFKMMQYYQQYGNWRSVAEAWHGGSGNVGSGDSYADSVFKKAGMVLPNPTFDLVKAFKLFIITILFFILGNKISKGIISLFGSPGFKYYL